MKAFILGALVVIMGRPSCGHNPFNVIHFEKALEKEAKQVDGFLNILKGTGFKAVEVLKQWQTSHVKNLGTFSWKNCGKPGDVILLRNLSLSPDPVVLPGSLSIGFGVSALKSVGSPLTAELLIQKKVGTSYITVPCIGNFGSCHYNDFCQILAPIPQCPPQFIQYGIPCHCPLKAGNYTLPNITFDLDAVPLPSGEYHGKMDMTYQGAHIGCIEIYASIDAGFE